MALSDFTQKSPDFFALIEIVMATRNGTPFLNLAGYGQNVDLVVLYFSSHVHVIHEYSNIAYCRCKMKFRSQERSFTSYDKEANT